MQEGIKKLNHPPKGWIETTGTLTEPNGYKWFSNNKSRFSGERKSVLVKVKQEVI